MRENLTADWAFGIKGAIENIVRNNFPRELRNWPLLQTFDFEAYTLHPDYLVIILKDKLSGIPAGPGVPTPFPHSDHPIIPPKLSDMELWQFYLREKFSLREEDAPLLIPIHDSGRNSAAEDYKLFSTEEKMFWDHQIRYIVARQMNYLHKEEPAMPNSPINITYNVSGTNTRVNINSKDSSVNISKIDNNVFAELRYASQQIEDEGQRNKIVNKIDEMEKAHGTASFLQKYKDFMSMISDHVTVFAPFIPVLSNLLT
jgi:hypothetical protein